jgi:hypothetical protein
MKIDLDLEKSSTTKGKIYFSPENDHDKYLLGRLVEKLDKTATKFVATSNPNQQELVYVMCTKDMLLDYLLNSRKINYYKES